MAITDLELRMAIKTLAAKGQSQRAIARQLDLCEGTVRYHLRRIATGAVDGRSRQRRRAAACHEAIEHWFAGHGDLSNLAALHDWLVAEHEWEQLPQATSCRTCNFYPLSASVTKTACSKLGS